MDEWTEMKQVLNEEESNAYKKRKGKGNQTIIIVLLVIVAILLGVIIYLIWSSPTRKEKREEEKIKKEFIETLNLAMSAAEKVWIDPQFDLPAGTGITITFSMGTVTFSWGSSAKVTKAKKEWESIMELKCDQKYSIGSKDWMFSGRIVGVGQKTGAVKWSAKGISALTSYDKDFAKKWDFQDLSEESSDLTDGYSTYLDDVELKRKSTDISVLSDCMAAAEMVAVDIQFDLGPGTEFEVQISQGIAHFVVRQGDKTSASEAAAAEKEWNSIIGGDYKLKSTEFKELQGKIVGTTSEYGSVSWKGEGVSVLTEYSSDFAVKWGL